MDTILFFDSLKFGISKRYVKNINYDFFDHDKMVRKDFMIIYDRWKLNKKFYGLKNIIIDETTQIIIIECSAKIFRETYYENINYQNFDYVLSIIQELGIFHFLKHFDKSKITFYRCDLSCNVKVSEPINYYITSFFYSFVGRNFLTQKYNDESLTFSINPMSKRSRIRGIFYDKYKEISKDKVLSQLIDVDRYINVIRYEITVNKFFLFRKLFGIEKKECITFDKIFKCEKNIFLDVFDLLSKNYSRSVRKIKSIFDDEKLSSIERNLGRLEICEMFNYDFSKISDFIKMKVLGNISKYLSDYSIININQSLLKEKNQINKYLNEFRSLLQKK